MTFDPFMTAVTGKTPRQRGHELAAALAPSITPGLDSVLCLSRAHFNEDIGVLRERAPRFQWIDLPTHILDAWHQDLLPAEVRFQGEYHKFTGPQYDLAWQSAMEFAITLLHMISHKAPVKAVMAANFDYWPDQCLRLACKHIGLPFVVLSREHFTLQSDRDCYKDYTLRPHVDAIGVAGPVDIDPLTKYGIIPRAKIHVTGLPRYDRMRDTINKPLNRGRVHIVLLPYGDENYLAPNNWQDMLRIFKLAHESFAHTGLGTQFVIKPKENTSQDSMDQLRAQMGTISVTNDIALSSILPHARAVIGYNSMALEESLLSPAEIIIPQWGDAARPAEQQIFAPGRAGLSFAYSPKEMMDKLFSACRIPYAPNMPSRLAMFRETTDMDENESASAKVVRMIEGVIR